MIQIPTHCPDCGQLLELSKTEVDLVCPNSLKCRTQIIGRLSYYCQRNVGNISGLSKKTVAKLVDEFEVCEIPDLYELPFDIISKQEGFGEKSVQKLQDSIQNSKQILDFKFLAGLGIEGIGPEVAKLICELASEKK